MTPRHALPHPPHDTDARLVVAAVAGDDGAFAALADRHRTALQDHCRRILRSGHDAEDAVQETLLRAWRRRTGFEGRSSFSWWLRCIATNTCMDVARRRMRTPTALHRPDDDHHERDSSTGEAGTDPAALVATRDAVEQAYLVAIRVLPPRQRTVLVLREVLRFSAADTADLLATTVASVNSALQRARSSIEREQGARRPMARPRPASAAERDLVRRLLVAHDRADAAAVVATLDR